tara:strand:- start:273 stop:662 length:390 start_codon:yes stop_codon:yes gene_type:complete
MKIKVIFIVLKKDNNIGASNDKHLMVYLDDSYQFPSSYISTKNEYETLKDLSNKHFELDFEWMKKELFDFSVLNNQESELIYLSCIPEVLQAEKNGSFYTLPELHDIGIKLKKNYERAIFKRGKSPVGW